MATNTYRGFSITVTLIETDPEEKWEATAYDEDGNVVAGPFVGATEAVAQGLVEDRIDLILGPEPDDDDDPEDGPSGPRV